MAEYVMTNPARYTIEPEFGIFAVTRWENNDGEGLDWWPNGTSKLFDSVTIGKADGDDEFLCMFDGAEVLMTPKIMLLSPGLAAALNAATDTIPTVGVVVDYTPSGYVIHTMILCSDCAHAQAEFRADLTVVRSSLGVPIYPGQSDQQSCAACHDPID